MGNLVNTFLLLQKLTYNVSYACTSLERKQAGLTDE